MIGTSKLLLTAQTDSLIGTPANPVVTYEVVTSDPDTSKYQSDSWLGVWSSPSGVMNSVNDGVLASVFPVCSHWRYSFKPDHLPFTMRLGAMPYTMDGGNVTINYYVNGQLVKTISSRQLIYGFEYIVQ